MVKLVLNFRLNFANLIWLIFWGVQVLASSNSASALIQEFVPLKIPTESLTFGPDDRLTLVGDATIELRFAVQQQIPNGAHPTILSLGEGEDCVLQIQVNPNFTSLSVKFAGTVVENIPCDFRNGFSHHIAIVFQNEKASIIVDGNTVKSGVNASLSCQSTQSRVIYLGTKEESPGFSGSIHSIRIWDSALSQDELYEAMLLPSLPSRKSPLFSQLLAASVFTSELKSLAFHEPEIKSFSHSGQMSDTLRSFVFPKGYRLTAIYVKNDANGIEDIRCRADSSGRPAVLLPLYPVKPGSTQFITRARTLAELADAAAKKETVKFETAWKKHLLQEVGIVELGQVDHLDENWSVFRVPYEGNLSTISGLLDSSLRTLRLRAKSRFEAGDELVSPMFGNPPSIWVPGNAFAKLVPQGAQFAGFEWTVRNGRISSIGLKSTVPAMTETESTLASLERFRWIERDARLPIQGLDPKPFEKAPRDRKPYWLDGLQFQPSDQQYSPEMIARFKQFSLAMGSINQRGKKEDGKAFVEYVNLDKHADTARSFIAFGWLKQSDVSYGDSFDTVNYSVMLKSLTVAARELFDSLDPRTESLPSVKLPDSSGPITAELAKELGNLRSAFLIQYNNPLLEQLKEGGEPGSAWDSFSSIMGGSDPQGWYWQISPLIEPGLTLPWNPPRGFQESGRKTFGTYTTPLAYRLRFRRGDDSVEMVADNGNRLAYKFVEGGTYATSALGPQTRLLVDAESFAVWSDTDFRKMDVLRNGNSPRLPRMFDLAPDYVEVDNSDKLVWGATFTLADRPTQVLANFKGYNLRLMNPKDHQADTGADSLLFRYPSEDSNDYYTTDSKVIVPYGLHFVVVNSGKEGSKTDIVNTSSERSESWSSNLGAHVGFGGASASVNSSWGAENSQMESNGTTRAICKTVESRYALVLDKARMSLSDAFVTRIYELRDIFLATGDIPHEYLQDTIVSFGTHYPYAVTYGGMAVMEMDFTEQEIRQSNGSNYSVEATAEATFAGFSGGVSAGHSAKSSLSTSRFESHERISFHTFGGSISRGQGWSLPKGEESPIYLDLREITELLNPVFFDDEFIPTEVRRRLHEAIGNYLRQGK